MPGIVGLISKMPRAAAMSQVSLMVESMRHESNFESGTWSDPDLGLYAGWVSRARSLGAGMPLTNERRDVTLIFAGQEFSDRAVRARLAAQGHDLGSGPASHLVHWYEEAPDFPGPLNGTFHGVIADRSKGTAMLFNDRYGVKRLYYYEAKDAFYFAAEAKAILAVCPELRTIDSRSLGEFVSCGCVLEDRTLFSQVRVLPGGSLWSFRHGSCEQKNTYFHPRQWQEQAYLQTDAYYEEVKRAFSETLPRYLTSEQQIGMSLTGGLDTRMVMAWQRFPSGTLPCYTFAGTYRDCHDVKVARHVAKVCQQPHELITVGDEFLSNFDYYASRSVYLTDGMVDVSRAPALFANERAREIAPVRLTGVYGSEILRSLRGFKPSRPIGGLFRPEFLASIEAAHTTYAQVQKLHPVSFTAFQPTPQRGVDMLEDSQLDVRTPFLDNNIVRVAFRASQDTANNKSEANDVCLRLIADGNPALRKIATDRGLGGSLNRLPAALYRNYLEFTFKAEYAYDYGMPQFVARIDHALSPLHLERLFLGRHKFSHFRIWYRDKLRNYVQEMLLDSRTLNRPYVNRSAVETIVTRHLKGNRNYTNSIHQLLSLELMHRLFIDASVSAPRLAGVGA